jgi:hypothetical protein
VLFIVEGERTTMDHVPVHSSDETGVLSEQGRLLLELGRYNDLSNLYCMLKGEPHV